MAASPTLKRIFWGWDRPVIERAVEFLTRHRDNGVLDLSHLLIVVPTSEAGRRLREALARAAERSGAGAVSVPHVWPPERCLLPEDDRRLMAGLSLEVLAWVKVLLEADTAQLQHLVPAPPKSLGWSWAIELAQAFTDLRATLGAGGYNFAKVAGSQNLSRDLERWQELALLEKAWERVIEDLKVRDAQRMKCERARDPKFPAGVRQIVVLPAPDLPPLLKQWLDFASTRLQVTICIQAPETAAESFDPHGVPLHKDWGESSNCLIPLADDQVHLETGVAEQADRAMLLLREMLPRQVAAGACDPEVSAHLHERLHQEGVRTYDPSGLPAERHGTVQFLDLWSQLCATEDWSKFSALMRIPDIRDSLMSDQGAAAWQLLEDLDAFAAQHLPITLTHALEMLPQFKCEAGRVAVLAICLERTLRLAREFADQPLPEAARNLVMEVFGEHAYAADSPMHRDHVALLQDWLAHCEDLHRHASTLSLPGAGLLALSIQELKQRQLAEPRGEVDLVVLGWLELLWEPAAGLVVAGLNEEHVPGTLISHPFLPDRVREELGLSCQASRFARDAYLLRALGEQRKGGGALHLLLGQWSERGDALRPSRLLFQCEDKILPQRVRRLFPRELSGVPQRQPARTRAWQLEPDWQRVPELKTISPSRLCQYLTCPFGYYLDHVLGMEAIDPSRSEMDPMAFGNLVHHALSQLTSAEGLAAGDDATALASVLIEAATALAHQRHGQRLPVPIALQLDSACQRLRKSAEIEADLRRQGWRTEQVEAKFDQLWPDTPLLMEGARLTGVIDRIDHNESGQVRIIDYKTGDKGQTPLAAHAKLVSSRSKIDPEDEWKCFVGADGERYLWLDLQLPLYVWAWRIQTGQLVSAAYWNLPKSLDSTKLLAFEELNDNMIDAAVACAAEAVRRIKAGVFWPPSKRFRVEDYPGLFHGTVTDSVKAPLSDGGTR